MRLLYAVFLIANVLQLIAVSSDARQQSCTANRCGEISKDIKTLKTKMNDLIALVRKALPPKPPGTFFGSYVGERHFTFSCSKCSQLAHIFTPQSFLSYSQSLLFLQGAVRQRKVRKQYDVFISKFQIARLMLRDHCCRYEDSSRAYRLTQSVKCSLLS